MFSILALLRFKFRIFLKSFRVRHMNFTLDSLEVAYYLPVRLYDSEVLGVYQGRNATEDGGCYARPHKGHCDRLY